MSIFTVIKRAVQERKRAANTMSMLTVNGEEGISFLKTKDGRDFVLPSGYAIVRPTATVRDTSRYHRRSRKRRGYPAESKFRHEGRFEGKVLAEKSPAIDLGFIKFGGDVRRAKNYGIRESDQLVRLDTMRSRRRDLDGAERRLRMAENRGKAGDVADLDMLMFDEVGPNRSPNAAWSELGRRMEVGTPSVPVRDMVIPDRYDLSLYHLRNWISRQASSGSEEEAVEIAKSLRGYRGGIGVGNAIAAGAVGSAVAYSQRDRLNRSGSSVLRQTEER